MIHYKRIQFILLLLFFALQGTTQNLLSNPNFTEQDSCPYTYGQIHFASPWQSGNDQSPDLFDSCAVGGFYGIPLNDFSQLVPDEDDGFAGIVTYGRLPNFINTREIITSRLTMPPPANVDIYCSFAVTPRPRGMTNPNIPNYTCYSNGIGLAIVYANERREIVFQAEEVIDNVGTWRKLRGCYEPIGDEIRVEIQNFFDNSVTEFDCFTIDEEQNVGYTFVDNVVVAPFDILPDTLVICDTTIQQFQGVNFYDLPLSWSDAVDGVSRTFDQSGTYTLLGDADICILEESIHIVVIDESVISRQQQLTKCANDNLSLSLNIPGTITWSNNQVGQAITIAQPGTFIATLATDCDTIDFIFEVSEIDCDDVIYTSNIFSPNDDNINDEVEFFLNPALNIDGTLNIFDRWGGNVYQILSNQKLIWNGKNRMGIDVAEGVYIWIFRSLDNSVIQSGEITLIR